jgi:hypothetical protein
VVWNYFWQCNLEGENDCDWGMVYICNERVINSRCIYGRVVIIIVQNIKKYISKLIINC